MATHEAVVTVGTGLPLELHQVPTTTPTGNQVRVRVEWTASTPLDMHQADGGLLVKPPQILGDGVAGTVVELGPDVQHLQREDKVFGFTWRNAMEKAHQTYCTTNENLLGKIPKGVTMQQAVVVPNNFVTVWHTLTADFGFELPWPKPEGYQAPEKAAWILIWGGSSSVGQYALQVLKYYGYRNLVATAGARHHAKLRSYGAAECFDYREDDVAQNVLQYISDQTPTAQPPLTYIFDCIGSLSGSIQPISRLARRTTQVAILLPVVVRDAAPGVEPVYTFDVTEGVGWSDGVQPKGVRTHFYLDNSFLADHLQSTIMPAVLEMGIVEPNNQVVVEGPTLLQRAEKARELLKKKEVSGARLVWRVA